MFRRYIFATSLILLVVAATSIITLLKFSEADRQELQDLVGLEDPSVAHQMSQKRSSVRRDIIDLTEPATHTVFLSDEAELVFDMDQNRAVERLTRPRAFIQEELSTNAKGEPQQFLRYMEAESGIYSHQEQKVDCQHVVFARYLIQGHELIDDVSLLEPILEGAASTVAADLSEGTLVEASDFSLSSPTGLKAAGRRAFYDGTSVLLSGNAEMGSHEGQVAAHEVALTFPVDGKEHALCHATFKDDVVIKLARGVELFCDSGQVDLQTGAAVFKSLPDKCVVCQQPSSKKGIAGTKIQSERLTAYFEPVLLSSDTKDVKIDEVIAEGAVTVCEGGEWTATGDVGTFKSVPEETDPEGGLISLVSHNKSKLCTFKMATGTQLSAMQMTSDTNHGVVCLHDVSGSLPGAEETKFKANEACWSNIEGLLLLKKGMVVENALGKFENDTEVTVQLMPDLSERTLSRLEATGNTTVVMHTDDSASAQTLRCHGDVLIDHLKHTARFGSPKNRIGIIPRDEQVFFSDGSGELNTDQLIVDYVSTDGEITASHIAAQGNTCVKGSLGRAQGAAATQYAICDVLEYWPIEQRILLFAREGRVALLDRPNGVAVSAPAVELKRDPITKKETIKGLGDVRFSLLDREYQRIRERFNLDPAEIP